MRVTVYTKPDCLPCQDVLNMLQRYKAQYNLEIEEIDVAARTAGKASHQGEAPAVELEGDKHGRLIAPIDELQLRVRLEMAWRALIPSVSVVKSRQAMDSPLDRMARYIGQRWLRLAMIALAIFVGLPWLAPVFAANGWWGLADPIYTAYAVTCHQLPERAGSVFGFQVAFCWRNTAIYGGILLFGILYGLVRDRNIAWLQWLKKPIRLWGFILLLLPMALDGFSHMLGLRDMNENVNMDMWYGWLFRSSGSQLFSPNWWLRIVTGLLAALGFVWFAFPRLQRAMEESEELRRSYRQPSPRQLVEVEVEAPLVIARP